MAKPELGTKRLCTNCGAKFYDLSKDPIVCPKCHTVLELAAVSARARPEPVAARAAAVPQEEVVAPETAEAEFVSLEEADAEAQGKKTGEGEAVEGGDEDIELEDETMDDAAFIEEQEEGDEDVTDIIGDVTIRHSFRTRPSRHRVPRGAIAQLGERLNGIQEVRGSTPLGSTSFRCLFKTLRDPASASYCDARGNEPVSRSTPSSPADVRRSALMVRLR